MKIAKRLLTMLPCILFFCQFSNLAHGQALPPKIRNYLNENYSGWKLTSVATDCYSDFERAVVTGDFDGDRKRDYVVKITRGHRGYFIALLERRAGYEAHVLESMSATVIRNTGLSISRKGEKYPVGGDYPELIYGRLPNDAPLIGPCASHASHYVYRNGRFN